MTFQPLPVQDKYVYFIMDFGGDMGLNLFYLTGYRRISESMSEIQVNRKRTYKVRCNIKFIEAMHAAYRASDVYKTLSEMLPAP